LLDLVVGCTVAMTESSKKVLAEDRPADVFILLGFRQSLEQKAGFSLVSCFGAAGLCAPAENSAGNAVPGTVEADSEREHLTRRCGGRGVNSKSVRSRFCLSAISASPRDSLLYHDIGHPLIMTSLL